MRTRGKWQGMWAIVRFNWPFYAIAILVLIAALVGIVAVEMPVLKWACGVAVAGTLYFLIGSLGVSHQVYDRSDLYRWSWLERALDGAGRAKMVLCHSGFDEVSQDLRKRLGDTEWVLLDHYEETRMTEASIKRARKRFPPTRDTLPAPFDRWPVATGSADVVFGLLAIHELRSEAERSAWFAEAKRCLRSGGRVVLAEHTRDFANLLAFGPGFLHFHSPASWRRCWEASGFHLDDEFRVTCWVRIFVVSPA